MRGRVNALSKLKEKKPPVDEIARDAIVNCANTKPWLICKVGISKQLNNHYAMIYPEGIDIYEYHKSYETKVKKVENHSWLEWSHLSVDHFFVKSIFSFIGDKSWNLKVLDKRHELENIIKNNTTMFVERIPRVWWRKILGFRSKTKWKMITASIIYLILFSWVVNAFSGHPTTPATSQQAKQINTPKPNTDSAKEIEAKQKSAEAQAKELAVAKEKADQEAKAKADEVTKKQVQQTPTNENVDFLNAVNKIAYNTFVEAHNVGDQMKQAGSLKISAGDFSDFMETDSWLWSQYIKDINPTKPTDTILILERQNILDDLNKIKKDSDILQNGAKQSKPDGVLNFTSDMSSASQDMILALNTIKQHYNEALSQANTDKYGVKPNWIPQ